MARTLLVQVVSPEAIIFDGEVEMVVATTTDGEIGILPLHAPIVAELKPGELRLKKGANEEPKVFSIYGGYLQFAEDKMIVLTDDAIDVSKLNVAELEARIEATKQRLAAMPEADEDGRAELERELAWSQNCCMVAKRRNS